MNRRSFLTSIFALGAAPAIVRAESIMRVKAIVLPGTAAWLHAVQCINNETGSWAAYDNGKVIAYGTDGLTLWKSAGIIASPPKRLDCGNYVFTAPVRAA